MRGLGIRSTEAEKIVRNVAVCSKFLVIVGIYSVIGGQNVFIGATAPVGSTYMVDKNNVQYNVT